jgi:hypothetical protein
MPEEAITHGKVGIIYNYPMLQFTGGISEIEIR